jgi:hypothetical protein
MPDRTGDGFLGTGGHGQPALKEEADMSRDTGTRDNSRRSFLRGLAVMGGVTAVAASTGAETVAPGAEAQKQPGKAQGYRVTPHVAKYYDKARF